MYKEWKKEIENKLKLLPESEFKDKVPSLIKRCPKCQYLTLEYEDGKIKCKHCGFEEIILKVGDKDVKRSA